MHGPCDRLCNYDYQVTVLEPDDPYTEAHDPHIITSSHYPIITLSHYHIIASSHYHIITLSHYHIITSSHHVTWVTKQINNKEKMI